MNRFFLAFLPLVALSVSCGQMPNPNAPDTTCDPMAAQVTLAQLHSGFILQRCGTPCHYPSPGGGMPEGTGFAYGDYTTPALTRTAMVGKNSLYAGAGATLKVVDPNNLANSSLWLKVSAKTTIGWKGPKGENTGASMPNDGTKLSTTELKQIKDWICTGAN
jgi:hypothetical protein